jgi:hypothetical protein
MEMNRRQLLQTTACGFGSLALTDLLHKNIFGAVDNPLLARRPHVPARAKRIIFLFMQGGPSQVDTFDYKPTLSRKDGEEHAFDDARVIANTGRRGSPQRVMKSPWRFRQYGQCGQWVSELFPETARHVDKFCMLHSLHTDGVAHGPATLFLHCGATNLVRPSMGAWVSYGLGTENENLPSFVTICPSAGNGGSRNYGNSFLPPIHQGTALGTAGASAREARIRDVVHPRLSVQQQSQQMALLRKLNHQQLQRHTSAPQVDRELEAVVSSYELAWRMQNHAPHALNLAQETAQTIAMYGIGEGLPTDNFGRQCLMARRLAERGVRYIQVTYGDNTANPAWDQHSNLPQHAKHARHVDRPVAALLADLEQRGLLDDTLVWWGSEFGRTPYAQDKGTGRDHNPNGFTVWLAGGGVKPGASIGATDEFGHKAIENKIHMHDLHATILHLLGLDHERLTYRYAGRDFRLTDVHGRVVHDVLA